MKVQREWSQGLSAGPLLCTKRSVSAGLAKVALSTSLRSILSHLHFFQLRQLRLGEIMKFPKSNSWYMMSINFREQACGVTLQTHQWDTASRSFILNRAHQSESIFSGWWWDLDPRLGAGKIVQLLELLLPKPLRGLGFGSSGPT